MPTEQVPGYLFGPRETRGVILGLGAGQLIVLSSAVAAAFVALHAAPGAWGVFAAPGVLVAGSAAAWLPIGHLTLEQWVPTTAGYLVRALGGTSRYRSREFRIGQRTGQPVRQERPWSLCEFQILSAAAEPTSREEMGILKNRSRSTYVCVLEVCGHSSALLDRGELDQRVGFWFSVLAGAARHTSPVRRIQWLARSIPEDREALVRHLNECGTADADQEVLESYRELLEVASSATQRHESYLAVDLDPRRAWRHIRIAGQGDVDFGARVLMTQQLRELSDWLKAAELGVGDPLSPRQLAGCIRYAYDPARRLLDCMAIRLVSHKARIQGAPGQPQRGALDLLPGRPMVACGLLRRGVATRRGGARFPAALILSDSRHLRTVSMVLEPVPPLKASQKIRRARVADLTEQKMRDRVGQIATARREQEQQHVERTEGELAAGHAAVRFAGYVGVTAASAGELEEACAEVELDAVAARLMLSRVYGDQEFAFTCLLPLCRGPP